LWSDWASRKEQPFFLTHTVISLSVSVIPEGLMIVTTLTLVLGSQRLETRGANVLKLASAATLGSVSVILSGKVR
jgi:Ca2+-transporting ATPase